MSVSDVHADLFKFLMAGRGGPAVTEWLGNRLANRVRWRLIVLTLGRDQVGDYIAYRVYHYPERTVPERRSSARANTAHL